jgi:hypothetical protein
MTYKIGEILISNREVTVEKCISGEKVVLPKGNKAIIGADHLAHHIKTGAIQTLAKDIEVKGYDREGLAEWIFDYMSTRLPILEIETEFDLTDAVIRQTIDDALEEIGFYGD